MATVRSFSTPGEVNVFESIRLKWRIYFNNMGFSYVASDSRSRGCLINTSFVLELIRLPLDGSDFLKRLYWPEYIKRLAMYANYFFFCFAFYILVVQGSLTPQGPRSGSLKVLHDFNYPRNTSTTVAGINERQPELR